MIHACIILAFVSGLALAYFFYYNKNRCVERFYYKHNKLMFALLTFTMFLLAVALVLNSRHLFSEFSKMFLMNFKVFKDLERWNKALLEKAARATS